MALQAADNEEHACCVCGESAKSSILCQGCAAAARKLPDMVPEQIFMNRQGDTDSCLVDGWGRVFRLAGQTEIGREPPGVGITIHQGSVSRKHVVLEAEGPGSVFLRDIKSTNGTVVGGRTIRDSIELVTGDLLFVGSVGFYFVSPVPALRAAKLDRGTVSADAVSQTPVSNEHDLREVDFKSFENTDLNEPEELELRTIEATGGGGGFVSVAGKEIQISMVQLELLRLLMERMGGDRGRPVAVRGYVHSSEILAAVSWDTAHPSDNHVKQLVRRLRRALARSGRDDLIESQQGLGYRLSVVPV